MRGKFITLEGIEGVGKTTAVSQVETLIGQHGYQVVRTREPGGTGSGERIRALLLDADGAPITPVAELLLMFAARAQHIEEVIKPALAAGHWVVCDRFTDATYAYQGGGRGLDKSLIEQAEKIVHPDLSPDTTILLDAEPGLALKRAKARSAADRFERETLEFFQRVRTTYLALAEQYNDRYIVIDASQALVDVQRAIESALKPHLS